MTRDIELKHIKSGTAVCDLSLAVNEKRRLPDGTDKEDTLYIDCTLWDRNAEIAAEYLRKGSQVLVKGRLILETWEGQDGKRQKHKLLVDRIGGLQMLDKAPSGGQQQQPMQTQAPPQMQQAAAQTSGGDIPF